jgi:hypothetical protein
MAGWEPRREAQIAGEADVELLAFIFLGGKYASHKDHLVQHDGVTLDFVYFSGHFANTSARLPATGF